MRLLLDSHIFLWYAEADPRLPTAAITSIELAEAVMLSVASIWELNVKAAKGKLPLETSLVTLASACNVAILDVSADHAEAVRTFPNHHRDPFDHMLLAQAQAENLTLVTHDKTLAQYGIPILLV